jgi:hypothetical protein
MRKGDRILTTGIEDNGRSRDSAMYSYSRHGVVLGYLSVEICREIE